MKKILTATALATAVFLAAGSVSTPSFAYVGLGYCDALKGDSSSWSTNRLEYKLRKQGISYIEIGTFSDCFKVIRVRSDGSKEMMLFDPVTLNRVYMY